MYMSPCQIPLVRAFLCLARQESKAWMASSMRSVSLFDQTDLSILSRHRYLSCSGTKNLDKTDFNKSMCSKILTSGCERRLGSGATVSGYSVGIEKVSYFR